MGDITKLESHSYETKALKRMGFTTAEINSMWRIRNRKTAKGAASSLRRVLARAATRMGTNVEQEFAPLRTPDEQARYTSRTWAVMWESGPHDWGTIASFLLSGSEHFIAEPYYSFDVHFWPLKEA